MKVIVSEKGQVTIPKELRDQMGIRPGQVIDFIEKNGQLIATKWITNDPVSRLYGILKLPRSTDELITEMRGEKDTV
jgi:AbrB family looped-hinge helix DNA binding protein